MIGIFILGLIVQPLHKDTGFAGSVALAIIMLPLVARSTQEVLRLVPAPLREASDALGVDRWRSIITVDPAGGARRHRHGLDPGHRARGRRDGAAPGQQLHVRARTSPSIGSGRCRTSPCSILTASDSLNPSGFPRAWGAALVLLVLILIANIGARFLLARSKRKLTG